MLVSVLAERRIPKGLSVGSVKSAGGYYAAQVLDQIFEDSGVAKSFA